jgi:phenylacetate-CoA ligase
MSKQHFDQLESRDHASRELAQLNMLAGLVRRAKELAPGWTQQLAAFDAATITSREALAKLPVLRKSTLKELQAKSPPFGGFATDAGGAMGRIMMSPGPIFEPEGRGDDWWRSARALYAAGIRKGDVLHNTFSYHLTPGGWILDAGARAIGCAVIPAGPGNTEQQLEAIAHLRPTAYCGVPDYLKILLDKAKEAGKDASSFKKALVSGGALFPSLRQEYKDRGINCLQCYATADVGTIAYESLGPDGAVTPGMIVEEGVIVEIVRPGTGDPVPDGEVGEVVVTAFNRDYPMIRFATGDLSAVLPGASPCGRTNRRIKGWLGRADQTTKVKGMFVHPEQIAEIAERFPDLGRLRLVVGRSGEQDTMTLKAEATPAAGLAERIGDAMQAITKLKGVVEIVAPGSLPNDGKVIADERSYG